MKTALTRSLTRTLCAMMVALPCSSRALDEVLPLIDLWQYLDNGVDQGTAWREPGFPTTDFSLGLSKFGFGEGDEFTTLQSAPGGTPLNTAYFRTSINVSDPSAYGYLSMYMLRDDGAIVYLNGVEVFRSNMPTGTVNYATKALRNLESPDEAGFVNRAIPSSLLVPGVNVIAVEVHQAEGGNDDLAFSMAIIGHNVGENQPPTAYPASLITDPDLATNITLNAVDPDGNPLTYVIVTPPQNGTLSGVEPDLTYTPAPGYTGPDYFTYYATDGEWTTEVVEVSINVRLESNQPPVADDQSVTVAEDNSVLITLTATDPDEDVLSYTYTGVANGTLTPISANTLLYQPAANYFGPDSFSFTVDDGNGETDTAEISITVTPVNDAPVAVNQIVTVGEDTMIAILVTATDVEGDTLSYSFTQPAHGTVNATDNTAIYQPAANYNGSDSFTFTVDDGNGGISTATVSITVTPVNDAPAALASAASANDPMNFVRNLVVVATNNQDAVVILNGIGSDVDGGSLSYAWYEGANLLPFSTEGSPTVTLPVGNYAITLMVSDGLVTASDTITVQVFTPCDIVKDLVAQVKAANLKPSEANGLLGHLNAACSTFGNGNIAAGVHQLELFKARVNNKVAPGNPALALALNASAQSIIDQVTGQ